MIDSVGDLTLGPGAMFDHIPRCIVDRMTELEQTDARDRSDGTARHQRLRQIPPETGKFIALLAAMALPGHYLEIGTSAGYSTLWLALACRLVNRRVITFEISGHKAEMARQTFDLARVGDVVDFVHGDALDHLSGYTDVSFCFLDAEKEVYDECYEKIVPSMVSGGLLVADNAISHEQVLQPMLRRALTDSRVDSLVVPIGKGLLLCRRR